MLTQTDIILLIEESPDAAPDMKRDLLQILPKLYECIRSSLLLDPTVGEDFLVLLPMMTKEQIAACWQALEEEGGLVETMIERMIAGKNESVLAQWQALEQTVRKMVKGADETMSRASDQGDLQHIETAFSEDV